MKKLLYIAIAALVALTACTKVDMEEYNPDRKVTFQVASYAQQTKANSSIWSEFTSFTAKAFLHAEGYTNGAPQDFFGTAGQLITPYTSTGAAATTGNVSYWGPSHDYYWPKGDSHINFIAWHDNRGVAPATATETSLSWTNYTVQDSDNLVYADEAWHYNLNTTNNNLYANDPVAEGVPMLFHHALAQVAFQAKIKSGLASDGFTHTVTITNFSLSGIHTTGSLSLTNSDPANDVTPVTGATTRAWTGSWVPSAATTSFSDAGSHTLSTTATPLVAMRAVLPQNVSDNADMVLTLSYTISTAYGDNSSIVENVTITKRLIQLVPTITDWLMGHKITYTIEFDPTTDSIQFKPTLVSWDNTGGGGVTLE